MNIRALSLSRSFGTDLSSRTRAARLRASIVQHARDGEVVEIDFSGVRTISDSFADELFAVLVVEQGDKWFRKHVRLVNVPDDIRDTILDTVAEREREPNGPVTV